MASDTEPYWIFTALILYRSSCTINTSKKNSPPLKIAKSYSKVEVIYTHFNKHHICSNQFRLVPTCPSPRRELKEGGTQVYMYIKVIRGSAAQMGCFFIRNPLTWVHFSQEKPLDMHSFFQNVQNFGCLPSKISKICGCSPCEHPHFLRNRPIFREKSLKMGPVFGKNDTPSRTF